MSGPNQLFLTVTHLLNVLFEREEANLAKREADMITRNIQEGGSPDGFRYMGVIYSQLAGVARQRGNYGRLNTSLALEMGAIQSDRQTLETDKGRIKQALALVLRDCRSFQDIRDALPNSLQEFIPECRGLERTRPEAFTLADNRRSYIQYMTLREKIDFYVATRLLF